MTYFKRLGALLTAVVIASAGSPSAPPRTQAAPPSSCSNSALCAYNNYQFRTDQGYELNPVRSAGTCENAGFPNQWTSVYNNSGRTIRLFKGSNCSQGYWSLPNGDSLANMSIWQPAWDDNVESYRFM